MINKEFLAQFSRHLIRNASNLRFEAPQAIITSTPFMEIKKREAEMEPFEAEKKRAEEMLRMKPQIQPLAIKMMPSIDISQIGDREFAVPTPKASEQEISLRKELENARERVIKSMIPPVPSTRIPQIAPFTTTSTKTINSFDIGKLNLFIKNPDINAIECNGPNNVLVVKKGPQAITTTTTLTNDEINDIIHKFSIETKTEITPIFKAAANGMMITAFVSPIIGTRFVLNKIKN